LAFGSPLHGDHDAAISQRIRHRTPEAFRRAYAASPCSIELPQILAPLKAHPSRAPAAALTGAPLGWPNSQSGAKQQTKQLDREQNVV
jgi:hypothetical protein